MNEARIIRETIEGFQAKRKLDGVSNRTVNMDVGALRKVLKRYGHWRRLQDHVTMLGEAEGAPIGRALTPEEQKRLLETAASNPEWQHVYCAAVLAANTSMRGVEVKHVRRKDVDRAHGPGALSLVREPTPPLRPDQAGEEVGRRLAVAAGRGRPARLPLPRPAPHGRHGPARGR